MFTTEENLQMSQCGTFEIEKDNMAAFDQLPVEIKRLINDGIYSLYRAKDNSFILITDSRQYYQLSSRGEIVKTLTGYDSKNLVESIIFPNLQPTFSHKASNLFSR